MSFKKFLITGGCGFIGSTVVKHILKKTNEFNIRKALKSSNYKGEKILLEKKLHNYKRIINLDGIVKNGDFEPKVFTSREIDKNDIRQSLFFVQPALNLTKMQKLSRSL